MFLDASQMLPDATEMLSRCTPDAVACVQLPSRRLPDAPQVLPEESRRLFA